MEPKTYVKAVESFNKAITLMPDVPTLANIHAWLAGCYRELKQYPNAIAAAKESLRLRPNYADTILGLGRTYYLAGQHQNALATFQEALRLNPKDAETINQTGLVYRALEQFAEAVDAHKEAIQLKPTEGLYHSNLGLTYVEMGMKEQAMAVQQTLQRIDSAKAKALDEQIKSIFPNDKDDPENLLVYASIASNMGYPQAALPVYRRVLLLKPEADAIAVAYRDMGDAYRQLKKSAEAAAAYQQALVVYQRLLRAKPQEAPLVYGLGHTYLGLGQKEQAIQVQRRLMALDKKYAQDLLDEINKSR
ncbi:MAG: tetratricopeptide repeat protein [Acidobacteriota bacterium]